MCPQHSLDPGFRAVLARRADISGDQSWIDLKLLHYPVSPHLAIPPEASYNREIVTLDFLGNLQRTHQCGELRVEQDGQDVVLMGWVNRRRDHGNLIFLDLRDRTGITQVVLDKEVSGEAHAKAEAARSEYVVAVKGNVRRRGAGLENPNMATGTIEVVAGICCC